MTYGFHDFENNNFQKIFTMHCSISFMTLKTITFKKNITMHCSVLSICCLTPLNRGKI